MAIDRVIIIIIIIRNNVYFEQRTEQREPDEGAIVMHTSVASCSKLIFSASMISMSSLKATIMLE